MIFQDRRYVQHGISQYWRDKREIKRRDKVNNYCKKLDTDSSILQETHVNFYHLHNIRELSDGEVKISPGKTKIYGILVLAKKTVYPTE